MDPYSITIWLRLFSGAAVVCFIIWIVFFVPTTDKTKPKGGCMKFYVMFYDDDGRLTAANKSWDDWSDADTYRASVAASRRPFVTTDNVSDWSD